MISIWHPRIFNNAGGIKDGTPLGRLRLPNPAILRSLLIVGLTVDAALGLIFVYLFLSAHALLQPAAN